MVWIKRFMFVLAIIIVLSGHYLYNRYTVYSAQKEAREYAKVTAESWVAAAKFKNDIANYHRTRDSLLKAEGLDKDDINTYLNEHRNSPEKYIYFATLLSYYVDSLVKIEDSLLKIDTTDQSIR